MPRKRVINTGPAGSDQAQPLPAATTQAGSATESKRSTRSSRTAKSGITKPQASAKTKFDAAESISIESEAPAAEKSASSQVVPSQHAGTEPEIAQTNESALMPALSVNERVALLAYSYWEARGRQGGSPEEDWYRAEQEILGQIGLADQ